MRLFAAVRPSPEALAHLSAALTECAVGERLREPRWIPAERCHVTVAFFGEVAESRVARLTARLGRVAARTAAGTLRLQGAGHFGRSVLWVGLAGDVSVLSTLAGAMHRSTADSRSFHPHLTVARGRGGADLTAWSSALSGYVGSPWPVSQLSLVRSTLGPAPVYTDLATWPLLRADATPR